MAAVFVTAWRSWAGIGGVAAALALRDCDVDTVVLEQADHVG